MTLTGNQIQDVYPINNWATPATTMGLTWLPPSYNDGSNRSYPLIIFLHGQGEIGVGVTGLNTLIGTALPQRIAQGLQPSAVNPIDGKTYEFIVVSPQGQYSPYQEGQVQYILADVQKRYRVDSTRIYVTGLSNGGYGTWTCVTDDINFAKKLAAVVPISAAPVEAIANVNGVNIPRVANIVANVAATNLPVWNICGDQDGFIVFAQAQTKAINASSAKTKALLTTLVGVGHSAWNQGYDPNFKPTETGGLNIYQWLLKYQLGVPSVLPVVVTPPVVVPPVVTPTLVATVQVYSDGSIKKI